MNDPILFLAGMAPKEIPAWFNHKKPEYKPPYPNFERDFEKLSRDQKQHFANYLQDTTDTWDSSIDEQVKQFEANEIYRTGFYAALDQEERYFQWRIYFAKKTCQHL